MSEQLHSFNTAGAVDPHTNQELLNNTGLENIVLDEYSNGAKHFYSVGEDGKKTHISHDDILEAYGHDPKESAMHRNDVGTLSNAESDRPKDGADRYADYVAESEADRQALEGAKRGHAKWASKTNPWHSSELSSDDMTAKKGRDAHAQKLKDLRNPSQEGATADDIRYSMWLEENSNPGDDTKTAKQGYLERQADRDEAYRKEQLRDKARLNMRVKTGIATPDEIAYYNELQDMAVAGEMRQRGLNDPRELSFVDDVDTAHGMAHSGNALREMRRRDLNHVWELGYIDDVDTAHDMAIAEDAQREISRRGLNDPRELSFVDDVDTAHGMAIAEDAARFPGRFARARNWGQRTRDRLYFAAAHPREALRDREGRRTIAGVVVGALAVGAAIWGISSALRRGEDVSGVASLYAPPAKPGGAAAGALEAAAAAKAEKINLALTAHVPKGGSFTQAGAELLANLGIKGDKTHAGALYNHLAEQFHGNFFTEAGEAYVRKAGDFGVSAPGTYHWRPEVAAEAVRKAIELGMNADEAKKMLGL